MTIQTKNLNPVKPTHGDVYLYAGTLFILNKELISGYYELRSWRPDTNGAYSTKIIHETELTKYIVRTAPPSLWMTLKWKFSYIMKLFK